ncbi:UNVERIFIED_CONTAM: General transcription and DNA repair factor IIH subunit TFB2 [Sesamum latifolium]|uniref:RNA polymerase II transcription factor B subunit 2 n=1 Tax=Sesamum latifolium TaxID=2727402 RepID=A0AAW2X4K0_9LAMI
MDMVASLPAMKLDKLYENSFICEAILRSLPPLAKKYVLQLLYIDGPVTAKWLEEWVLADGNSKHRVAVDRLIQLRILTETVERDDKEPPKLTESGFQFLLMDTNAQLWYIVREYINNCEDLGVDTADLIFIPAGAQLSYYWQGFVVVETNFRMYAYSTSKLHCEILRLFARYAGSLLHKSYISAEGTSGFTEDISTPRLWEGLRSLLVDSAILVCLDFLVSLWEATCVVNLWLPGVVVPTRGYEGIKTEEFQFLVILNSHNGEVAYPFLTCGMQIISFLQQNAHPRVAERTPSVPENVTDQIRLWEADLNRVEMTPAHLYDEFPSRDVFDAACDFAREYGGAVKAEISSEMKELLRGRSTLPARVTPLYHLNSQINERENDEYQSKLNLGRASHPRSYVGLFR